jgi:signal transduction histidine kinase
MTRRITLVMVAVVAATLLMAGLITVVVTQVRATSTTEDRLVGQLDDLNLTSPALQQLANRLEALRDRAANRRGIRRDPEGCPVLVLRRALQLRDAACVLVAADGTIAPAAGYEPVAGLPEHLDATALSSGAVLHGSHHGVVWAAKGLPNRTTSGDGNGTADGSGSAEANGTGGDGSGPNGGGDIPTIVFTQDVRSELQPVRRWLVLAAIATLGLGVAAAVALGRRLTRPLAAAQDATARIAAGDLSARVPEQNGSDELSQLGRSINQMAVSLERSRALEQQFLLSVSHDLRTPLTSIQGYAEALADGTLDDVGKGATVIRQEAGRLERLVGDLLELARLESRQFRLEERVVDLAAVGRRAVDAFRTDGQRAGVVIDWEEPTGSVPVRGDDHRLGQVAANLLENALKYAERRIEVRAGAGGSWSWLAVADDGPGIDPEDLPHVFERLYVAKLHPARREAGSGLGLAIVRELVHAHGGEVTAEAAPGRGTRMVVRLPAASIDDPWGPAGAAGPQIRGSAQTRAGASPPGQRTVTSAGGSTPRRT